MIDTTSPPPLDELDTMTVTYVTVEAFLSLEFDTLTPEMARGAVLLFEAILSRAKPFLPQEMGDVFEQVERVSALIRSKYHLPQKI